MTVVVAIKSYHQSCATMSKRKNSSEGDEVRTRMAAKEAKREVEEIGKGTNIATTDTTSSPSGSPAPAAPPPPPPAPPMIQLRTSVRVQNNQRRKEEQKESAEMEAATTDDKDKDGEDSKSGKVVDRPRRAWEQWSPQDMSIFFEGLNEYGKNFEQIQSYFSSKSKNRGGVSKTREQIRTFYYRAWHKITPYIDFTSLLGEQQEMLKKSARELYGLINYGELRKKLGSSATDEKNLARLNELVFKGHTTLRSRGRTIRVRTPICRALKRLIYRLETVKKGESSSSSTNSLPTAATTLPTRISVEMKPKTSADFFRVHGQSLQNPHLEVKVDPSVKISTIIDHLDKKWTPNSSRIKAAICRNLSAQHQLAASQEAPSPLQSPSELCVSVQPGAKLVRPILTPIRQFTSATLCLESLVSKVDGSLRDSNEKSKGEGAASEDASDTDAAVMSTAPSTASSRADPVKTDSSMNGKKEEEEELRTSWTREEGLALSIGELYLMLGCLQGGKVSLIYGWKSSAKEDKNSVSSCGKNTARKTVAKLAAAELVKKQQSQKEQHGKPVPKSPVQKCQASSSAEVSLSPNKSKAESASKQANNSLSSTVVVSPPAQHGRPSDGEFRRPVDPFVKPAPVAVSSTSKNNAKMEAFKEQLAQFLPKFSNRRGRPMSKRNVISRQLIGNRPLQPKTYMESNGTKLRLLNRQTTLSAATGQRVSPAPHTNTIVVAAPLQHQPVIQGAQVATILLSNNRDNNTQLQLGQQALGSHSQTQPTQQPTLMASAIPEIVISNHPVGGSAADATALGVGAPVTPAAHAVSPPGGISSLFDTSLPDLAPATGAAVAVAASEQQTKGDHFLDSVLENSNSSVVLQAPSSTSRVRPTPPSSPSRGLSDNGWMQDLSMPSFWNFGGGDSSSSKTATATSNSANSKVVVASAHPTPSSSGQHPHIMIFNEDSSHSTSSEVDRQLQSMMSENSVDFTAKFSKLAAHVNSEAD